MATSRKAGDVTLDFRNMDFSTMSEKGLPDPHEQIRPLKLLELLEGSGRQEGRSKTFLDRHVCDPLITSRSCHTQSSLTIRSSNVARDRRISGSGTWPRISWYTAPRVRIFPTRDRTISIPDVPSYSSGLCRSWIRRQRTDSRNYRGSLR